MRRDAQSIVLILVGGAVLRISVSDIYLRYVKEGLRPFLLAAGAALLLLGVVGAVRDGLLRSGGGADPEHTAPDGDTDQDPGADHGAALGSDPEHDHPEHDHPEHDHPEHDHPEHDHPEHDYSHGPRVAWLLCLPVFAIFLVAPPALGSYAAARDAGTVAKPAEASDYAPLPAGDPVPLPMSEYAVRAVWDDGRTLKGRSVSLRGFVTPREEGGWYLTRMMLSCCAADARAIKVEVRGAEALPADTWAEVTGTWVDDGVPASETAVPILKATDLKRITPPKDPYG